MSLRSSLVLVLSTFLAPLGLSAVAYSADVKAADQGPAAERNVTQGALRIIEKDGGIVEKLELAMLGFGTTDETGEVVYERPPRAFTTLLPSIYPFLFLPSLSRPKKQSDGRGRRISASCETYCLPSANLPH